MNPIRCLTPYFSKNYFLCLSSDPSQVTHLLQEFRLDLCDNFIPQIIEGIVVKTEFTASNFFVRKIEAEHDSEKGTSLLTNQVYNAVSALEWYHFK
jgi:hypothetical protein